MGITHSLQHLLLLCSDHTDSRLSCFIFNPKSLVASGNRPYTRVFCVSEKGGDISEEWRDAMLKLVKSFLYNKELPYIVPGSCVLGVHLFLSLLITTDSSQFNDFFYFSVFFLSFFFFSFGWVHFHFRIKAKIY